MITTKLEIGMNYYVDGPVGAGRKERNSVLKEGVVSKASYIKYKQV